MTEAAITLGNDLGELDRLTAFLNSCAEQFGIDARTCFQLNLVCDELVTNTIMYGYKNEAPGTKAIDVVLGVSGSGLTLLLVDEGIAFNPLERAEVRTDLSVEERGIGGLGIHFVRQVMDELHYERKDNQNRLRLSKKLQAPLEENEL
ncbi:ATP-binding protein [Paenibacillus athensensis]|uniref:Histidine kinase/HSP90-like ATPase domain-containing protein n=1 Tax=Paenibacillus athensensis TaxID=1967502 RepID=A0A4Y8PPX0_9BACL|nr:ATP-binding protein [Paenibacillus athensensis]MCD1260512.1 ATP-binding protein [Paenibacillus athensensis]